MLRLIVYDWDDDSPGEQRLPLARAILVAAALSLASWGLFWGMWELASLMR